MDERKKKRYTIGKGIEKQEKNHITAGWEEEKMGERIAKNIKRADRNLSHLYTFGTLFDFYACENSVYHL